MWWNSAQHPYSIGSKMQSNSPCLREQVKEHMWSVLSFDMVHLELFSDFRDGANPWHTPHACTYWPYSDSYLPRQQCLLPKPLTVISQANQSQPWSVVGWKNSRKNSSAAVSHLSDLLVIPGSQTARNQSVLQSGAWKDCVGKGFSLLVKPLKDF